MVRSCHLFLLLLLYFHAREKSLLTGYMLLPSVTYLKKQVGAAPALPLAQSRLPSYDDY